MKLTKVQLTNGPVTAEVLKENAKTLIVRLPDGNIIKRHKVKHRAK